MRPPLTATTFVLHTTTHPFDDMTDMAALESPQLGLSLGGAHSPFVSADKLDFLTTYGLELDEEDEEEEEDEERTSTAGGSGRRFKKAAGIKGRGGILKLAHDVVSPLSSPRPQSKKLINLVKPRSGSLLGDISTARTTPERPVIRKARSSTVSVSPMPAFNRPRGSSRASITGNAMVFKDYSQGVSSPKPSRRGYFEMQDGNDDDSHLPTPAISEEEEEQSSSPTRTIESSHTMHVDYIDVSPPLKMDCPSDDDVDHLPQAMVQSTSSLGGSGDSSNGKDSGPFTPPALPARPLAGKSFFSTDPTPRLSEPESARASVYSVDSAAPSLPSKDGFEDADSVPVASASRLPLVEKTIVIDTASLVEAKPVVEKKGSKEEIKKVAAEVKAAAAQEKAVKQKQESKRKQEERERKILLKSYDELEVERFLADFGKHVTSVRSNGVIVEDAHFWPRREEWRHSETGSLNLPGFARTYFLSALSYISSGGAAATVSTSDDLQEATPEEQFRIAALRANAERLYMTALPMYEGTFARLRQVWRWESKVETMLWSATYFVLWFRGLLLCGVFALCIYKVLRVRAYPPKPEVIRQMLREQNQRSRELQQAKKAKAEDVIQQAQEEEPSADNAAAIKKKTKYRLAADATRKYGKVATFIASALADVHERIKNFVMWKSVPATWRAISLLAVGMLFSCISTPWIMARLPGLALGICLFIVAPIAEHRPEWLGVEWKNPFDFLLAGVPNDAQYAMQVLRTRAAAGEALTGDMDIADWMKAEGTDDEDDDLPLGDLMVPAMPTLPGLEGVNASTAAVSSAVNQTAAAGTSSVDWKKWKSRVAKGRELAVAGSEVLSGQRALQLPRIPRNAESPEASTARAKMVRGMAKGINWGLDSIQNTSNRKLMERRLEGDEVMTVSDGVYWAVYNGSCGHVVITPDRLRFRSLFARKITPSGDATEEQVMDATTGDCQVSQAQAEAAYVRTLVDVNLQSVFQLKKTKTVNVGIWGIDGLEVRSKGGKVFQFSSIVKRDEAFNRILALAPQHWNKL